MTPLHEIGDFIRGLLLAVPLPVVRGLFILVPLVLLVWVLFLPSSQTSPADSSRASPDDSQGGYPGRTKKVGWNDLKIWAALALLIQIVIYALL